MGTSPDAPSGWQHDETRHEVRLTHGFYLQRRELSREDWIDAVGHFVRFPGLSAPRRPVTDVTWWDALDLANALSLSEGLPACFTLLYCHREEWVGLICEDLRVNAAGGNPLLCQGYRLPTEAEWEYAYRAGTDTAFYDGPWPSAVGPDGETVDVQAALLALLDPIAWYPGNADGHVHDGGKKLPNAWGLYDMAGNVSEWCWDLYTEDLGTQPAFDPLGAQEMGHQVVRGGDRDDEAERQRAGARGHYYRDWSYGTIGFRLARTDFAVR